MSADQPNNPFNVSLLPAQAPTLKSMHRGGELYCAQIHGKYYTAAYYGRLYSFNLTAIAVTVIAGSLASKFAIYNPPNSTVNAELVDFDMGIDAAATIVNAIGLYWQSPTLASLATLTTIGVFGTNWFNCNNSSTPGQVTPYSILAHSGTPVRIAILTTFGAITAGNANPIHQDFDGKIILPPGHLVSIATSTTISTAVGLDLGMRWLEAPL